jgi:hypothetical protein
LNVPSSGDVGIGMNHLAFNLKYGTRPVEEVIQELGQEVVPYFPALANK